MESAGLPLSVEKHVPMAERVTFLAGLFHKRQGCRDDRDRQIADCPPRPGDNWARLRIEAGLEQQIRVAAHEALDRPLTETVTLLGSWSGTTPPPTMNARTRRQSN
eukprot:scaffold8995_cov120-Isochrysis_galbana.AAC.6